MKLLKSKSGFTAVGIVIAVFVGLLLLFGTGGIIKFVFFQEKTPLIIAGGFILLLLYSKKKRERR